MLIKKACSTIRVHLNIAQSIILNVERPPLSPPLVAPVPQLCFHAPTDGSLHARDVITNQKVNWFRINISELVVYPYRPPSGRKYNQTCLKRIPD